MDCKEFRELLDLYVDGELPPEAMASASVHATECEPCRRAQTELTQLQRAVKSVVSQYQPPSQLVETVQHVYQSRWRRLLFQFKPVARSSTSQALDRVPLWRRRITLPVPVFTLLLMALLLPFGWFTFNRRVNRSSPETTNKARPEQINSVRSGAPEDQTDLARFDHGERAAIYKIRRIRAVGAQQ